MRLVTGRMAHHRSGGGCPVVIAEAQGQRRGCGRRRGAKPLDAVLNRVRCGGIIGFVGLSHGNPKEIAMEMRIRGKDQFDIDQKIWDLRANPKITIKKIHPTEDIQQSMRNVLRYTKIEAQDTVSALIEYDES
jgi:hypothetical protein